MASVTVRVDDETKAEATAIVEDFGFDLSSVTRAFYRQIVRENPPEPLVRRAQRGEPAKRKGCRGDPGKGRAWVPQRPRDARRGTERLAV